MVAEGVRTLFFVMLFAHRNAPRPPHYCAALLWRCRGSAAQPRPREYWMGSAKVFLRADRCIISSRSPRRPASGRLVHSTQACVNRRSSSSSTERARPVKPAGFDWTASTLLWMSGDGPDHRGSLFISGNWRRRITVRPGFLVFPRRRSGLRHRVTGPRPPGVVGVCRSGLIIGTLGDAGPSPPLTARAAWWAAGDVRRRAGLGPRPKRALCVCVIVVGLGQARRRCAGCAGAFPQVRPGRTRRIVMPTPAVRPGTPGAAK